MTRAVRVVTSRHKGTCHGTCRPCVITDLVSSSRFFFLQGGGLHIWGHQPMDLFIGGAPQPLFVHTYDL